MSKRIFAEMSQSNSGVWGSPRGSKVGTKWIRVRTSKKAAKLSKPMKMAIRKEIKREVEVKSRQTYYGTVGLYGPASAAFNSVNNWVVCPSSTACDIQQGTGEGQRIGNQVRTRKLVFSGVFTPKAYSSTTNPDPGPLEVKMFFYRERADPAVLPAAPSTDFFQFNNSSNAIPDSLMNQIEVVNTDKYQLFTTRSLKLGYQYNNVPNAGSGSAALGQIQPNNDFNLNVKFEIDLTKYLPRIVRYNDNNAEPTSAGIYCLIVAARADGAAIGTSAIPFQLAAVLNYEYEDA